MAPRPREGNGHAPGRANGEEVRLLGYSSGAPRVSTRRDAEIGGPRAHILGVMSGFERIGWSVQPFIIGDRSPGVVARDAGKWLRKGRHWALLADMTRIGLAPVNMRAAWRTLAGRVDWVFSGKRCFRHSGGHSRGRASRGSSRRTRCSPRRRALTGTASC